MTEVLDQGDALETILAELSSIARDSGGWINADRFTAMRIHAALFAEPDPLEGQEREVECCPGKSCGRTTVVRRAGYWVRTSNGEVYHGEVPE